MKLTQVLWKQHLGRMIRRHWLIARERVPRETYLENYLTSLGIKVEDPKDIINPKKPIESFEPVELLNKEIKFDQSHPDWKDRTCLTYKDHNVLQKGVTQALLLTNTVQVKEDLPEKILELITDTPANVENFVKRAIRVSNIFDAHQELLPKIKDPERPAWVFPRAYGLTAIRRIRSLSQKLLQLCEMIEPSKLYQGRSVLENGTASFCIEKEEDLLLFALTLDLMLMSRDQLSPIENPELSMQYELPSIYPLHPTIGLQKSNIYKNEIFYPVSEHHPKINIHTIFAHYDPCEVKNLTELSVTEDQIRGRSLIKSFTAAASCAKIKFGEGIKTLPHPITVQCIQSDAERFHFSVFQLNTLDLDNTEGVKNLWWNDSIIRLFDKAGYIDGRPGLEGYNPDVFKKIYAFYRNT